MRISDFEQWNRNWRLYADKVSCRRCQAEQFAQAKNEPFQHSPLCPYRLNNGEPWDELDSALQSVDSPGSHGLIAGGRMYTGSAPERAGGSSRVVSTKEIGSIRRPLSATS